MKKNLVFYVNMSMWGLKLQVQATITLVYYIYIKETNFSNK